MMLLAQVLAPQYFCWTQPNWPWLLTGIAAGLLVNAIFKR